MEEASKTLAANDLVLTRRALRKQCSSTEPLQVNHCNFMLNPIALRVAKFWDVTPQKYQNAHLTVPARTVTY
eukprot:6488684-Amphidinium_carterae.1